MEVGRIFKFHNLINAYLVPMPLTELFCGRAFSVTGSAIFAFGGHAKATKESWKFNGNRSRSHGPVARRVAPSELAITGLSSTTSSCNVVSKNNDLRHHSEESVVKKLPPIESKRAAYRFNESRLNNDIGRGGPVNFALTNF